MYPYNIFYNSFLDYLLYIRINNILSPITPTGIYLVLYQYIGRFTFLIFSTSPLF